MLKKKKITSYIKALTIFVVLNIYSNCYSEIIIFKDCSNGIDGFKKNNYTINLKESLMTRDFIYDSKTFKKYRLTDITTKKSNKITRFIYEDEDSILTDKIGYPQFYTQLVFERNNPVIMIKTVINNESAVANLSKCKEIENYQSES